MNTWNDLVVNIVVVIIGLLFTYIGDKIAKNNKATTFIQATTQLAEAAVAYAEKLGIDEQLKGAAKKNAAVQAVISSLEKLGFKNVDLQTVENAVEAAFAKMKDTVEAAYSDNKEAAPSEPTAPQSAPETAVSQVATAPESADVSK